MQSEFLARRIQVGDRLEITIKGTDEEVPTTYLSCVDEVSQGAVVIKWPTSRGVRALVHDNEILYLFFIQGSEICSAEGRILKRMVYPVSQIVVRCEGPIRTWNNQRRALVRVPAMIDVHLSARTVAAKPDANEELPIDIIKTRTVDISGSGFSIYYAVSLPIHRLYDVKLKIPTLDTPPLLMAKVVRVEPTVNRKNEVYYEVGFAFIEITESIRRQIIKYVFRVQQNAVEQVPSDTRSQDLAAKTPRP